MVPLGLGYADGLDAPQVAALPRYTISGGRTRSGRRALPQDVIAALRAMGHTLNVPGEDNQGRRSSDAWGNMNTVLWDRRNNTLGGGSDPRTTTGKADVLPRP
jgi:gamma-glutamyltranspeptidase/glutathione hydrolase